MAKIIAPVVTIFNEEEKPDYAGNKKVIDFLIEGGLDGILVLGSAGEFPDLNEQERLDFFRFYAEYVNGRVELLAGNSLQIPRGAHAPRWMCPEGTPPLRGSFPRRKPRLLS